MNRLNLLIAASILYTVCSCENKSKPENKSVTTTTDSVVTFSCSSKNENFDKEFFPFDLDDFKISRVKIHFNDSVRLDTAYQGKKIYNFTKFPSGIVIKIDSNNKAYIDEGHMEANIFKSKNGIEIGMSKKDFFNLIGHIDNHCTLYTIIQKNKMMYHFKFVNNKLAVIDFEKI